MTPSTTKRPDPTSPRPVREQFFTPDKLSEIEGAPPADGLYVGGHSNLVDRVTLMLDYACERLLPDDVLDFHVCLYPLVDDSGWVPSLLVYLMLQPVGDLDGDHQGDFMSPHGITQEIVDLFVTAYAERTVELRGKLREARAAGIPAVRGMAVPGHPG